MSIKDMVRKHLTDNGYDGLYFPNKCSCRLSDLMHCGEPYPSCHAGHFIDAPEDNYDYDYWIGEKE